MAARLSVKKLPRYSLEFKRKAVKLTQVPGLEPDQDGRHRLPEPRIGDHTEGEPTEEGHRLPENRVQPGKRMARPLEGVDRQRQHTRGEVHDAKDREVEGPARRIRRLLVESEGAGHARREGGRRRAHESGTRA